MSTMNLDAAIDAETKVMDKLRAALADFGDGFVGAPRVSSEGAVNGVNQWWFVIGGGDPSNLPQNGPVTTLAMGARLDGIFVDRKRAWQFAMSALAVMPVVVSVARLHRLGNPECQLSSFEVHGRNDSVLLWRVMLPARIVFDTLKG